MIEAVKSADKTWRKCWRLTFGRVTTASISRYGRKAEPRIDRRHARTATGDHVPANVLARQLVPGARRTRLSGANQRYRP